MDRNLIFFSAVAWGGGGGGGWTPIILTGTFNLVSGHTLHVAFQFNVFLRHCFSIKSINNVKYLLFPEKILLGVWRVFREKVILTSTLFKMHLLHGKLRLSLGIFGSLLTSSGIFGSLRKSSVIIGNCRKMAENSLIN